MIDMKDGGNPITLTGINGGQPIPDRSLRIGTKVQIEGLEKEIDGLSPDKDAKVALLWVNDLISEEYFVLKELLEGKGPVTMKQVMALREDEMLKVILRSTGMSEDDLKNLQTEVLKEKKR